MPIRGRTLGMSIHDAGSSMEDDINAFLNHALNSSIPDGDCLIDEAKTRAAGLEHSLQDGDAGNNQYFAPIQVPNQCPQINNFDGNNSPRDATFTRSIARDFQSPSAGPYDRIPFVRPVPVPATEFSTDQDHDHNEAFQQLQRQPQHNGPLNRPLTTKSSKLSSASRVPHLSSTSEHHVGASSSNLVTLKPNQNDRSNERELSRPAGIRKPLRFDGNVQQRAGQHLARANGVNGVLDHGMVSTGTSNRARIPQANGILPNGHARLPPLRLSRAQYRALGTYAMTHGMRVPFKKGLGLPKYGRLAYMGPGRLVITASKDDKNIGVTAAGDGNKIENVSSHAYQHEMVSVSELNTPRMHTMPQLPAAAPILSSRADYEHLNSAYAYATPDGYYGQPSKAIGSQQTSANTDTGPTIAGSNKAGSNLLDLTPLEPTDLDAFDLELAAILTGAGFSDLTSSVPAHAGDENTRTDNGFSVAPSATQHIQHSNLSNFDAAHISAATPINFSPPQTFSQLDQRLDSNHFYPRLQPQLSTPTDFGPDTGFDIIDDLSDSDDYEASFVDNSGSEAALPQWHASYPHPLPPQPNASASFEPQTQQGVEVVQGSDSQKTAAGTPAMPLEQVAFPVQAPEHESLATQTESMLVPALNLDHQRAAQAPVLPASHQAEMTQDPDLELQLQPGQEPQPPQQGQSYEELTAEFLAQYGGFGATEIEAEDEPF
ncbi:uncharacterized protein HMPREF1541_02822 [Cyphellophora europaea CBS 101466]|uniref:Uncharacterized protein n=1 Tax=Cyphellophora europaea (strain CBS 101466) TaxID=1220924 RepID=W2S6K1_CYPE1|nr:uncharacterized protein HMPREF1541_02822 [Cyphellophora europaea CBS 101466]ETN43663.1 hypothetical protein HMPREF1541_02822 [Cyphellophora europaea CBS 101466]